MNVKFTNWVKWQYHKNIDRIKLPGVYAIAKSEKNIAGETFSWISDIIYFGMTNSQGGLISRLQQFNRTIRF